MTREEAIYRLDNLWSVAVGKEDEAIDMAIEALTNVQNMHRGKDAEIIKDILKTIPTAYLLEALGVSTVEELMEEPQGEWIDTTDGQHYKCSVCGYRAGYWFNEKNSCEYSLDMSEWLSNYCPNCGAKMGGAE